MESGCDYFKRVGRLGIASSINESSPNENSETITSAVNVSKSEITAAITGMEFDVNQSAESKTNQTAGVVGSKSHETVALVENIVDGTTSKEINEIEELIENFIGQLSLNKANQLNTSIDLISSAEKIVGKSIPNDIHVTVVVVPAVKNIVNESASNETIATAEMNVDQAKPDATTALVKNIVDGLTSDKTFASSVNVIGEQETNRDNENSSMEGIHELKNKIKIFSNFDPFRRLPQPFLRQKRSNSLFEFYRPDLAHLGAIEEQNIENI